jgi:hypothetical protein
MHGTVYDAIAVSCKSTAICRDQLKSAYRYVQEAKSDYEKAAGKSKDVTRGFVYQIVIVIFIHHNSSSIESL